MKNLLFILKLLFKVDTYKQIVKVLFCKHDYVTYFNLYGDYINRHNGYRRVCRCCKCGKLKHFSDLDKNCKLYNLY